MPNLIKDYWFLGVLLTLCYMSWSFFYSPDNQHPTSINKMMDALYEQQVQTVETFPSQSEEEKVQKIRPQTKKKVSTYRPRRNIKKAAYVNLDNVASPPKKAKIKKKKVTKKKKTKKKKNKNKKVAKKDNEKTKTNNESQKKEDSFLNETTPQSTTGAVQAAAPALFDKKKEEQKEKELLEEETKSFWLEKLTLKLDKKNTLDFIKEYKKGAMNRDSFYYIIETLLADKDLEKRYFLLYAAENSVDFKSFRIFTQVLESNSPTSPLYSYATTAISRYKGLNHLAVLNQALTYYINEFELELTLKTLEKNIDYLSKVKTNEFSSQNAKKIETTNFTRQFSALETGLQKIINEQTEEFSNQAQFILDKIDAYKAEIKTVTADNEPQ